MITLEGIVLFLIQGRRKRKVMNRISHTNIYVQSISDFTDLHLELSLKISRGMPPRPHTPSRKHERVWESRAVRPCFYTPSPSHEGVWESTAMPPTPHMLSCLEREKFFTFVRVPVQSMQAHRGNRRVAAPVLNIGTGLA